MINPSSLDLFSLPYISIKEKSMFPDIPGIYFAIDSENNIQYIGRSINIRKRWLNHHRYRQLSSMEGVKIAYLHIDSVELLHEIEKALIAYFKPSLNCQTIPRISKSDLKFKQKREFPSTGLRLKREQTPRQSNVAFRPELQRDDYGKFKSKGLGLKKGQSPRQINVAFPPDIDTLLRKMENRSEFIREAVREKLEREGLY